MTKPKCYLMFAPSTGGSLYHQWSTEEVPGALAYFEAGPEVDIPGFKVKVNAGRAEIIRDINGPRWNGFYKGFCHFIKSAMPYKGSVALLKQLQQTEKIAKGSGDFRVKLIFQKFNGDLTHAEFGKTYKVEDYYAVACLAENNQTLDGVKTLSTGGLFNQKDPSFYSIKLRK